MQPLAHAKLRVALKMKISGAFLDSNNTASFNEISGRVGADALLLFSQPTVNIRAHKHKAELLPFLPGQVTRVLASVSTFR